jgi:hypothetical protein
MICHLLAPVVALKPQGVMQKPHLTGEAETAYTARHANYAATLCFC